MDDYRDENVVIEVSDGNLFTVHTSVIKKVLHSYRSDLDNEIVK